MINLDDLKMYSYSPKSDYRVDEYLDCSKESIITLYLKTNDELFETNYKLSTVQQEAVNLSADLKLTRDICFWLTTAIIVTYLFIFSKIIFRKLSKKALLNKVETLSNKIENMSMPELKKALAEDKKLYNKTILAIMEDKLKEKLNKKG